MTQADQEGVLRSTIFRTGAAVEDEIRPVRSELTVAGGSIVHTGKVR